MTPELAPAPTLRSALRALSIGRDLTAAEMGAAVSEVLAGEGSDVAVAALLTALRVKGETADELAGAAAAVRNRMAAEGLEITASGVLDTCGTGGDGANTVNVSTAAALVVAAAGAAVAKHGNRAASGNSGSAEVLAELGVLIDAETAVLNRCLAELGITFLYAPKFHPGLRAVAGIRKQLPFRTLFNLVGPLVNPARPDYQLIGVSSTAQARLIADALARLGIRRAAVVTGGDGLDEVSLDGATSVLVVEAGAVSERRWEPADFGDGRASASDLRVAGPAESAERIRRMLDGERGPVRDTVVANAAAALWVAGESVLSVAVGRAVEAIDSGGAARLLTRWGRMSHEPAPAPSAG